MFATQFLVPLTLKMTLAESFGTSALLMLTLTLPAILMVREPSPKSEPVAQEPNTENEQPQEENQLELHQQP